MKNLKYVLFTFIICFISLSNVYADATCVYKVSGGAGFLSTNFNIICTADNTKVECNSDNNNLKVYNSTVQVKNFKNGNLYICPNNIYISLNDSDNPSINISSTPVTGYIGIKLNNEASSDDSNYIISDEDKNDTTKTEEDNKLATGTNTGNIDLEHICTGPIQGVFTTLGWVFFILKIAIPLILIIFGSIDLAKAVVSSKDDEIKKSIKTLVVRAIAGIIIFFVPTILGFVVSLFDKSNVYNGTFTDCTECMLNPNHKFSDGSTCSGLRGE